MNGVTAVTPFILFSYHLTPEVTGHIRDMYPAPVALPNQLGEAYLPRLLHLPNEVKQLTVLRLVTRDDIRRAAEQVMTVLRTPNERIQLLASIA